MVAMQKQWKSTGNIPPFCIIFPKKQKKNSKMFWSFGFLYYICHQINILSLLTSKNH